MSIEGPRPPRRRGISALAFLAGLLAILQGMALFGVAAAAEFLFPVNAVAPVLAVGTVLYATLCLTLAYGLAAGEPWAWTVGVASQLGGIALLALAFRGQNVIGALFSAILALSVLAYLVRPNTRERIERERS